MMDFRTGVKTFGWPRGQIRIGGNSGILIRFMSKYAESSFFSGLRVIL